MMISIFIVLSWLGPKDVLAPTVVPYDDERAACSAEAHLKELKIHAKVSKISLPVKDCKATADPNFLSCLVGDGVTKTEGTCEPRREFVFKP